MTYVNSSMVSIEEIKWCKMMYDIQVYHPPMSGISPIPWKFFETKMSRGRILMHTKVGKLTSQKIKKTIL